MNETASKSRDLIIALGAMSHELQPSHQPQKSQYLGNFAPRDFRLAVDGLRAIQAPKRAAILEEALQVFGPAAPPKSRSRRHQILIGFTKRQRKLLSDLDQRYFEGKENV